MIHILIIAPTPALRAGLRALLASAEIEIIGETATLADQPLPASVDLVVLADLALLSDTQRVLGDEARVGLLLLADDERPVAALRTLPLAGWGLVTRDASPSELQAAAQAVAQGLVVLPPALAGRLLNQRTPDGLVEPPAEALTPRETEVLELMSQGLPNKQIARALQISEHTVKFHISSIFAKLGAASRTDAVSRGARQGLITL